MAQEKENIDKKRMELRESLELKNWSRCESLSREALAKVNQDNFTSWYAFSLNLAISLVRNEDSDNRKNNIEEATRIFKKILQRLSSSKDKYKWASIQQYLGFANLERLAGDKIKNINRAIKHFEQAIQVFTADKHLEDWILTKRMLAETFAEKMVISALNNLATAIKLCGEVLERCNDESSCEHQIEVQEMIEEFRKKFNFIKDSLELT